MTHTEYKDYIERAWKQLGILLNDINIYKSDGVWQITGFDENLGHRQFHVANVADELYKEPGRRPIGFGETTLRRTR